MRHASPFAQILDDAVAATGAATVSRPAAAAAFPRATGFFEFTIRGPHLPRIVPSTFHIVADPAVADAVAGQTTSATHRVTTEVWPQPQARASVRARKRLTAAQRQAFDDMVLLGASLAIDFTDEDLRGAYRQLARRYHPDRHPGCSERDRARLGNLFARAHECYRVLLGGTAAAVAA